ncbi:MAG: hypothetical protein GY853_13860 [PVC group bacterium]|nr:hypothetical protein [PVC group bacterium]
MDFKCHWYFGDGEESTEYSPVHVYKMAGEYDVLLIRTFTNDLVARSTFVIYVYAWQVGLSPTYTNKCIRDAIKLMQGTSMCEWGNRHWLWPEAQVGACNGYRKNNEVVSIVLDTYSGKHYRIGQRDQWQDRLDNLGYTKGGFEIPCRWKMHEYTAPPGEYQDVRQVEAHAYLRPFWEEDREKEGHNPETGYRVDFKLTARMYKDGNLDMETETKDVPMLADITYPKEIVGPRIQAEFETSTSSFRCVGVQQQIESRDKKRGPLLNTKNETIWAREFSRLNFWLSRNSVNPLINRANAIEVAGSFNSLITGADSVSDSALLFGANDGLSINFDAINNNHVLSWWSSRITVDSVVWNFGTGHTISLVFGNGYELVLNNGSESTTIPLEYDGRDWILIAIKMYSDSVRVYANKEDYGIKNINFRNYSGLTRIMNNTAGGLFDVRRTSRDVSKEALNYYYDCVARDNGVTGFLPTMR